MPKNASPLMTLSGMTAPGLSGAVMADERCEHIADLLGVLRKGRGEDFGQDRRIVERYLNVRIEQACCVNRPWTGSGNRRIRGR